MGESKLPKTPPKRPGAAILAMKASVTAAKPMMMSLDEDERGFMTDLGKLVAWIEELEASTEPFAEIVPLIDPAIPDDSKLFIGGLKGTSLASRPAPGVG